MPTSNRRTALWFLGFLLLASALMWSTSGLGATSLMAVGTGLGLPYFRSLIGLWDWLPVAGFLVIGLLAWLFVCRFGAPREVWFMAAAASLLTVGTFAAVLVPGWVQFLGREPMISAEQMVGRAVGRAWYTSLFSLGMSVIGYPAAAWVGAILGARSVRGAD